MKLFTKTATILSVTLYSTSLLFGAGGESLSVRDSRQLAERTAAALAAVNEWRSSEQAAIVLSMANISDPALKAALDSLFNDPEMQDFMRQQRLMMKDSNRFSHSLRTDFQRSSYAGMPSQVEVRDLADAFLAQQRAYITARTSLLNDILKRHRGIMKTRLNSDGVIALIFPSFKRYKVEIALYDWPIVTQGPFYSAKRFVLHDLAAALHAKSINDVIETEVLRRIDRVDTQLYRLPWAPDRALNDHDFVVVAPYYIYGEDALATTYADLLETQKYLREQTGEKEGGMPIYKAKQTPFACSLGVSLDELDGILVEIVQVITGASIWCVGSLKHANIILYRTPDGELRAAFTNIRRPAFGSSEAIDFYRKEPKETLIERGNRFGMGGQLDDTGNWQSGWYGLRDMLREADAQRRYGTPSGGAGAGAGSSGT